MSDKQPHQKVSLIGKFDSFSQQWTPKIVGALNGQLVKLAKVQGEFVWHSHEREDEFFLVVKGELTLRFRDGEVVLGEGEFIIVPRGVEHQPYAREEAHIVLFEPEQTAHTGDVVTDRTVNEQVWI